LITGQPLKFVGFPAHDIVKSEPIHKSSPPYMSLAPFVAKFSQSSVSIPAGGNAKVSYSAKGADLKVKSATFNLTFLRKPPSNFLYLANASPLPEGISAVIEPEQLTIRPWDKKWQTATKPYTWTHRLSRAIILRL